MIGGELVKARFSARLGALGLAFACVWPRSALAETGDLVEAMALFRDGKALLSAGDYERACPKLAESYRLDAGSGTLLALAICHERWGKLASAWGEYADVASRSKLEGRSDREQAARRKATELEPLVSTLTVVLRDDSCDLERVEVRRNGVLVSPPLLGTALPVDGGTQTIEASTPGRKPWRLEVSMADREQHTLVIVPWLAPDEPAPSATARDAHIEAPADAPSASANRSLYPRREATPLALPAKRRGLSPLQITGVAALGAGAIGLVVGTVYGVRAIDKNDASKSGCNGDYCDPTGKKERLAARSAGSIATIAFVEGGVLGSVGIAMYLLGRSWQPSHGDVARVRPMPWLGPSAVGGALSGRF
jgi:hypothetical protein